jgi:hypothetical protein
MSMKNSDDTIGNRTCDLLDCSVEPHDVCVYFANITETNKYFITSELNSTKNDVPRSLKPQAKSQIIINFYQLSL